MEKGTDKGYWETGVMPDVDVMKAQMFLVLDSDAYYNTLHNTGGTAISTENSSSASTGGTTPTKAPKKYVVHASGRVTGDENTYNAHSYNVYCDITTLKKYVEKRICRSCNTGTAYYKKAENHTNSLRTQMQWFR